LPPARLQHARQATAGKRLWQNPGRPEHGEGARTHAPKTALTRPGSVCRSHGNHLPCPLGVAARGRQLPSRGVVVEGPIRPGDAPAVRVRTAKPPSAPGAGPPRHAGPPGGSVFLLVVVSVVRGIGVHSGAAEACGFVRSHGHLPANAKRLRPTRPAGDTFPAAPLLTQAARPRSPASFSYNSPPARSPCAGRAGAEGHERGGSGAPGEGRPGYGPEPFGRAAVRAPRPPVGFVPIRSRDAPDGELPVPT